MQIFEVAPTFVMVDIQKAAGDTAEYLKVSRSTFASILSRIEYIWNFELGFCPLHFLFDMIIKNPFFPFVLLDAHMDMQF